MLSILVVMNVPYQSLDAGNRIMAAGCMKLCPVLETFL